MNAKQEILDALEGLEELNLTCETSSVYDNNHRAKHRDLDRVRAILETHELVPVSKQLLKPSEVTEQGHYWRRCNNLAHRYYGPIQPPEYTGD